MTGNDSMVDMKSMAATTGALIQFRKEVEFVLSYCHKTGMTRRWGGGSRGYDLQVTSANSCRTRQIEGVRTVELVCVAGLLRMGGESFLLPVWCGDLLEMGSLVKRSWM